MARRNQPPSIADVRRISARRRGSFDIHVEPPKTPDDVIVTERIAAKDAIARRDYDVTVDIDAFDEIIDARTASLVKVYSTLDLIKDDLTSFFPNVPAALPETLSGTLLLPDGTPGETLAIEAARPQYTADEKVDGFAWPTPRTITDRRGAFSLRLPTVPVPGAGLTLTVRGSDGTTDIRIARTELLDPKLGVVALERRLSPLPRSALARLTDVVPVDAEDAEENPGAFAEPEPALLLGEGDCARSFRNGSGVIDRFRYSLLVRLVDPEVNPKQIVVRPDFDGRYVPIALEGGLRKIHPALGKAAIAEYLGLIGQFRFADRVPIDQPIDVADFHSDVEAAPGDVPKASSLGLGYIVNMHQTWIPQGLSLGNLAYSLPLAPGEEQQIAVFEQRETLRVRDTERLDISEAQRFDEATDTSTQAVFESAFDESVRGGSRMKTSSSTGGFGIGGGAAGFFDGILAGIGIAGGYGSTSSGGSSSSWQNTSKDFVSSANEEFHSQLSRQAKARRSAMRTAVRAATATETSSLTTKRIANHNHCHALTVQYWDVLRHYAISSKVDDVQLVAFVPLELIPWLPAGQERTLPTGNYTRNQMVARYAMVHHYADVLEGLWRRQPKERYGLRLLRQFMADPTAEVESSSGPAARTITVEVTGTFLPFEDVWVTAVTESGSRLGPFALTPATGVAPGDEDHESREAVLDDLRDRRTAEDGTTRRVSFSLPTHIARNDVVRFDLSRRFRAFSTTIDRSFFLDVIDQLQIDRLFGSELDNRVRFSATELERQVGGPMIWNVKAALNDDGDPDTAETYVDAFGGRGSAQLLTDNLPLPAARIEPVLSYSDLLRVEEMFQHVVRNSVEYSKAVWRSMTAEERAILLERYTLGVPTGGVEDQSQEIPLLNAVANRVLGFFGNSMVMPFSIPPDLAARIKRTSRDIQDALLKFHRQAFIPPQGNITLPTRGMLGEAVLGSCNSCEKIDLTRFWNWKDSEVPKVDEQIKLDVLGQSSNQLIGEGGAQAPGQLTTGSTSIISNNLVPSATVRPSTTLLEKMIEKMPEGSSVKDITGLVELSKRIESTEKSAGSARDKAMDNAKSLAEKAMSELPNAIKAQTAADAAEKKAEDEKAEKAEKQAADKKAAGLKTLTDSAGPLIAMAGAQGDADGATGFVQGLLTELFGDQSLATVEKAGLLDTFKVAAGDDAATTLGKTAFLSALGLPVN